MTAIRSNIIPALRYRDAEPGRQFLESAFGAEPKAVHRDGDGVIRHAVVGLGGGLVMVGAGRRGRVARRRAGAPAGLDRQPVRGRR